MAESKIETGKPVFDRTREQEKLERLKRQAATPFTEMAAEELFFSDHVDQPKACSIRS